MPQVISPKGPAAPIRRKRGITVTIVNQGAVDAFVDDDPMRLNAGIPGSLTIANGTKIAASGGQLQISDFKGIIWTRSNSDNTLEVQP